MNSGRSIVTLFLKNQKSKLLSAPYAPDIDLIVLAIVFRAAIREIHVPRIPLLNRHILRRGVVRGIYNMFKTRHDSRLVPVIIHDC